MILKLLNRMSGYTKVALGVLIFVFFLLPAVNVSATSQQATYHFSSGKIITNVSPKTTAEAFLSNIDIGGAFVTLSKNGVEINNEQLVGTGTQVIITYSDSSTVTYTVVIFGDTDGDGDISSEDVILLKKYLAGITTLDNINLSAGDVTLDGSISSDDIIKIKQHLADIEEIDQNNEIYVMPPALGITVYSGNVVAESGSYTALQAKTLGLLEGKKLLNGIINASITPSSNGENGLVFRVNKGDASTFWDQNNVSYYMLLIDANGNVILGKVENNDWQVLGISDYFLNTYSAETTYSLKVSLNGGQIDVYTDGNENSILSYNDLNPLSGWDAGFRLSNQGAVISGITEIPADVSFLEGKIVWNAVAGAQGYQITANGEDISGNLSSETLFYDMSGQTGNVFDVNLNYILLDQSQTLWSGTWNRKYTATDITGYLGNWIGYGNGYLATEDKSFALYNDLSFEKGYLSGSITPVVANDCGIIFGASTGGVDYIWENKQASYYVALVNSNGYLILGKVSAGKWTSLAGSDSLVNTFNPSKTYDIQIRKDNGSISMTASDGNITASLSYTDSSPLTGTKAGIRAASSYTVASALTAKPFALTGISLDSMPSSVVLQYHDIRLDGVTLTAAFENGDTQKVNINQTMLSGFNNSVPGQQTVTVSYTADGVTKTTAFTVTVIDETALLSIAIETPIPQTTLYQGDSISLTGASIRISYSDSTFETVPLTASMLSGFNSESTGGQTITVSYTWYNRTAYTSFDVTVLPLFPVKIETVLGSDNKILSGKDIDLDIIATFNNGATKTIAVTRDMITGLDETKLGSQVATISYTSRGVTCTTTCNIEVLAATEQFASDFESSTAASKFTVETEAGASTYSYAFADNVLSTVCNTSTTGKWSAAYNQTITAENYSIQADFTVTNAVSTTRWFGIFLEEDDGSEWYAPILSMAGITSFLQWYPSSTNRMSGSWGTNQSIDSGHAAVVAGETYRIRLIVLDNVMYFTINGIYIGQRTLPSDFDPGYCGIIMSGMTMTVDNFSVNAVNNIAQMYGVYKNSAIEVQLKADNVASITIAGQSQFAGTYTISIGGQVNITAPGLSLMGSLNGNQITLTDYGVLNKSLIKSLTLQNVNSGVIVNGIPDVTNSKIVINYYNGTTKTVDLTTSMISGLNNTVTGDQTATVSYTENGETATTPISFTVLSYQPIYFDNFNNGNNSLLSVATGSTAITKGIDNGTFNITSTSNSTALATVRYEGFLPSSDYRVDVDVSVSAWQNTTRYVSLFYRNKYGIGTDYGYYTAVYYVNGQTGMGRFITTTSIAAGSWGTVSKGTTSAITAGETYHLTAIIIGQTAKMYINGTLVQTLTLPSDFSSGSCGFLSVGVTSKFDNFSIRQAPSSFPIGNLE